MKPLRKWISGFLSGVIGWSLIAPGFFLGVAHAAPEPSNVRVELQEFRTRHSKRFRNPDGSLSEEVFLQSIHYRDDKTGKWEEIDTTLEPTANETFGFASQKNRLKVFLAAATERSKLLKVAMADVEVSLTPLGLKSVPASVHGNEAIFRQAGPGVDLQYLVEPDGVKEQITLDSLAAANHAWRFMLETAGLTPQEDGNGGVALLNSSGATVLTLQRPFAVDATGATIDGALQLKAEQGATIVNMMIDRDWLTHADRVYPIIIDPTISLPQSPFAGQDTFVGNQNTSANYSNLYTLETGNDTVLNRGVTRTLISFNLPVLPSGAAITDATLTLTEHSGNSPNTDIDLYRVTSYWDSSVTWATQPTVAASRESRTLVTGAGTWNWGLTALVTDWYLNKQPNYGLMLRHANETLTLKSFRSSRWTTVTERPKLTITYNVEPLGYERFWAYAGNMNVANGNLVLSATDTAIPGRGLTATVSRTYNSRSTYNGSFGYGWTSELDMRLHIPATPTGPRGPIAFFDVDGTVHYFAQNTSGGYDSPPGLYRTLTRNQDGTYSVTEKSGLVYLFASDGKIQRITDTNQNSITFLYEDAVYPARVTKIMDPATPLDDPTTPADERAAWIININYGTNGKVSTVTNQAGTVTKYEYDTNGNLIQVTAAFGLTGAYTVKYSYDAGHNLISIAPPAGNKQYFMYTADDRLESVSRVNAVENASFEVDGNGNNLPDYWELQGAQSATAGLDSSSVPHGKQRFAINVSIPTGTAYGVYLSNRIPVDPSKEYRLSGEVSAVKVSGGLKTVLSVLAYAADGTYLGEVGDNPREKQDSFAQIRWTIPIPVGGLPTGTATIRVKVAATTPTTGGTGTSYFDSIQFEEGSVATDFTAPVTYTVDPVNRAAAMYDGNGRKVKWTYNDSANPLTVSVDPSGLNYQTQVTWEPDKPNLVKSITDPVSVQKADGKKVSFEYDSEGNLTRVLDQAGNDSRMDYTTLNDLEWYADPKEVELNPTDFTPQVSMTYDANRNAVTQTNRFGMSSAQSVDLETCYGCVLGSTPALSLADNRLLNGNFERSASGTWPDNWTYSPTGSSVEYTGTTVLSGQKAIRLAPTTTQGIYVSHADLFASENVTYVLSLSMRADNTSLAGAAGGVMEFLNASGTVLFTYNTNKIVKVNEWNRVTVQGTAPAGTAKVRITLAAPAVSTPGNVYFDAVQLEETPFASAFNLVDNPSFEQGSTSPDLWQSSNIPFQVSTTEKFAGNRSVSLANASATSGYEPTYYVPYTRSKPLLLTAFVKAANMQNGKAYIKLKWYDMNKTYLGQTESNTKLSGTHGWTRIYAQIPANSVSPSLAVFVKPSLVFEVTTSPATGTAYFDGVRLEEAGLVTGFQYSGTELHPSNNWVTQVTNPVGNWVDFEYNSSGFTTKVTPNGVGSEAITYTPDNLQRLQNVTLPNGLSTGYQYNQNGLLASVTHTWTDGTGQSATTTYAYNQRDQLKSVTDPLNYSTTFVYDAAGNLTQVQQPNGSNVSYQYNAANRLTTRSSVGGPAYQFRYDENGNLLSTSDTSQTWTYTYDRIDQLKSVSGSAGGSKTAAVDYVYDRNGNVEQRVSKVIDGATTNTFTNNFTYNEIDQLLTLDNGAGLQYARFSYDEQGRLVKQVFGNTIYSVMEYDDAGRLWKLKNLKLDGTLLNSYEYHYNNRGYRDSETVNGGPAKNFTYDAVGQLLSDGTFTYTYTPRGNRKTRQMGSTTENYCYDAADRLIYRGSNSCSSNPNFTYDANGNMLQNASGTDTWAYVYDGENRLIEAKKNGSTVATFTYDALGRRTSKTSGATTLYHYDGLSNRVLYETNSSGDVLVWYTWAGDRLVSQKRGENTYYYQYNGHGDVVALHNSTGAQVNSYAYDVWGKPDTSSTSETVTNPYRYAGYRRDEEVGLYYLNARYYDPDMGRFLTKDTYRSSVPYAYADNDPVNYIDPTGYLPMEYDDQVEGPSSVKMEQARKATAIQEVGDGYRLEVYADRSWTLRNRDGQVVERIEHYNLSGVTMDWPGYALLWLDREAAGGAAGAPAGIPGIIGGLGLAAYSDKYLSIPEPGTTVWDIRWVLDVSPMETPAGVADTQVTFGDLEFGIDENGWLTIYDYGHVVFYKSRALCVFEGHCSH